VLSFLNNNPFNINWADYGFFRFHVGGISHPRDSETSLRLAGETAAVTGATLQVPYESFLSGLPRTLCISQPPPRKSQDCQKPQRRSGVVEGDCLNTSGELDWLESRLEKEVHAHVQGWLRGSLTFPEPTRKQRRVKASSPYCFFCLINLLPFC